jgi:hypothetical protein
MLFKKCRYGIGNVDESFYLAIPLRFFRGDLPFVQEWNSGQLSGILLYPLVKLFMTINGSTDGIILRFRYIYTTVQIVATVAIYCLMRKKSRLGALIGGVLFLVYAPFNIMALSYNTMSIISLSLSLALMVTASAPVALVLSGVFFAIAVLAQPYLAAVYFLYVLAVVIYHVTHKTLISEELLSWKKFLSFSAGILLSAAVFLVYILSKISIRDIFDAIPHILEDPEHSAGFLRKLAYYPYSIFFSNKFMPFICIGYAATCIVGMVTKRARVKNLCLAAMLVLTFLNLMSWALIDGYINYLMLPLNFLALFCYLTYKNKKLKLIFDGIWLPGMLFTFCVHMASNQRLYAISSSSTVALIGSVVIIVVTMEEVCSGLAIPKRSVLTAMLAVLLVLQLGSQLYYRWNGVYWENSIKTQEISIDYGPEKGLLVSDGANYIYSNYYSDLQYLDESAENVLFLSPYTWLNLCGDWKTASYSAWMFGITEQAMEMLYDYYELHSEKLPDEIFIDSSCGDYADVLAEKYGFEVYTVTPIGNIIMKPVAQ